MTSLVELFEQLIHEEWRLETEGNQWVIRETQQTNNPELRIGGCRSLGFSLDKAGTNPWPFIKSAAPKGIRSACDGIIIAERENQTVIFAVELKSGSEGKAHKQLTSSRYLIDYLCKLLTLHTTWSGEYIFAAIIASTPTRRTVNKRPTAKDLFPIYPIENQSTVKLTDFMDKLS